MRTTVVPLHPGIFSAWGMLAAEPRADFRGTWFTAFSTEILGEMERRFSTLEKEAVGYFARGADAEIRFTYQVEARYRGQEHGVFALYERGDSAESFAERFHAAHEKAYSFRLATSPIEVTMLHLEAVLRGSVIAIPQLKDDGRTVEAAQIGSRPVYFGGKEGWLDCPVFERSLLPRAARLDGPLLVEEATATSLVLPGQVMEVNAEGLLLIREHPGRAA